MSRGGRPVSAVLAVLPNRALVRGLSVWVDVSVAAPVAALAVLLRVCIEDACWYAGIIASSYIWTGSVLGESRAEIMPGFVFRHWSSRAASRGPSAV
eukprot:7706955-Pyramimonas_sp.AAC.1